MAVRRNTAGTRSGNARRSAPTAKAAPAKAPTRKPAPAAKRKDVTEYADKPATAYQKAFARYIVQEIGYDPDTASSQRAAFLKGVSIAVAARPLFNASDFIEEWREKTGETKRGPKPKAEVAETPARRRKAAPAPVEDEFEDEEEELDDDADEFDDDDADESDDDADEFDDDADDESDDADDEFDDEPEEEPTPAPKRRGRPAKAASASARTTRGGAAPAKKTAPARRSKPAADDDEFLF